MDFEEREKLCKQLKESITDGYELQKISDDELRDIIKKTLLSIYSQKFISIDDQVSVMKQVYSSIRGLGILDLILADESITEVMINGPKEVFVERSGRLYKIEETFEDEKKLEDIVQRIVGQAGREVNQANPIVDTRLPDGSRVNVVLPPISLKGAIVTIRKFSKTPMTMEQLIRYGSITPKISELLRILVEAKYNIFISGGTGSGKTTFLNALSNYIPKDERIITIEDSAELQITGIENLVSLETRNANSAGSGEVTIRDLIKSALRMRPERIIVGEVRGAEALDIWKTFRRHVNS